MKTDPRTEAKAGSVGCAVANQGVQAATSCLPTDADMDNIHHALGRPVDPAADTYRNYFNCETDGDQARRFEALGLWDAGPSLPGGSTNYHVNGAGKAALAEWLDARRGAAGLRLYVVRARHCSTQTVLAKSPAAAKYLRYMQSADCFSGGYPQFLRLDPRVTVAERKPRNASRPDTDFKVGNGSSEPCAGQAQRSDQSPSPKPSHHMDKT